MAKKQQTGIRFLVDFYERGDVKYAAGKTYPETEETLREFGKGNAEQVPFAAEDVEPDPAAKEETPAAQ